VVPGSPSEKAGLQKYDILLKLGDQPVCNPLEIGEILDANGGEKPMAVEFIRAGQRQSVELLPEKRPEVDQEPAGVEIQAGDGQAPVISSDEKIRVVRPGMILPADADAEAPAAEEGTK
ncbi:MAG: PDZ domain-containing protein, partial [Thermoguttaceae bacterium]|nr:PDZ domain-containing protein [Thermoguttaceae bacterium]